jgi:hypothetical protein
MSPGFKLFPVGSGYRDPRVHEQFNLGSFQSLAPDEIAESPSGKFMKDYKVF